MLNRLKQLSIRKLSMLMAVMILSSIVFGFVSLLLMLLLALLMGTVYLIRDAQPGDHWHITVWLLILFVLSIVSTTAMGKGHFIFADIFMTYVLFVKWANSHR